MTEKEKAIEVSAESTEKKTKKPHRRRAIVITVVVLALLTAGGIAWKAHADRLMAEARADCCLLYTSRLCGRLRGSCRR